MRRNILADHMNLDALMPFSCKWSQDDVETRIWRHPTSSRSGNTAPWGLWVGSFPPPLALVPRHRRVPGHGLQLCPSVSASGKLHGSRCGASALEPNGFCTKQCAIHRNRWAIFHYIFKFPFNSYQSARKTSLNLLQTLEFDTETQKRAARTQTRRQSWCRWRSERIGARAHTDSRPRRFSLWFVAGQAIRLGMLDVRCGLSLAPKGETPSSSSLSSPHLNGRAWSWENDVHKGSRDPCKLARICMKRKLPTSIILCCHCRRCY